MGDLYSITIAAAFLVKLSDLNVLYNKMTGCDLEYQYTVTRKMQW